MNPKVEATITLTFGETKVELTMAEAKKLLAELQELVGPKISIPSLPEITRPRPPRDDFPSLPDGWPKINPSPKWREGEVICGRGPARGFATGQEITVS